MSVSCELCREHLGEVLEAEIRQATSHLITVPPIFPTQPEIAPANGASILSITKDDAELSVAELTAVIQHSQECAQCSEELRQMRAIHRALSALPLQSAPGDLRSRVRTQIDTAATTATATSSAIAVAPVRSSAKADNLWQRTQRGWNNVWNRPARTAWMGGSLAVGALGIFLLARLPEWSSTQSAQDVVAAANSNQSATNTLATNNVAQNNAAPVTGNTTNTTAPKPAVPNAPKTQPSSAPQKAGSEAGMTPPAMSPPPAFPDVPRDNAPSSFVAPPLPKLPPVRRITPKMPAAAPKSTTPKTSAVPRATTAPKKSIAPKTSANDAPKTRADVAPTPSAAKADASKTAAPPKIIARPEVQRDVIALRVAPLNSPARAMAPPSIGGFMSNSQANRNAENLADAGTSTDSTDAPTGPRTNNRMMRPNSPSAMIRKVPDSNTSEESTPTMQQARAQAREVIIAVTPPRDLSKARLLVTLAPDWQFSDAATKANSQATNDATLQREVWQGSAKDGEAVRVTLAIQPHFTLTDDANGGSLRAGRTPLMVELWDMSGGTRKLVASRRLELPAEGDDQTDTEKKTLPR